MALFGGAAVHRYSPDGELLAVVPLPAAQVTACTFGGPDLDRLYVTTSREGLDDAARAEQPLAGALFAVDVPGVPRASGAGVRGSDRALRCAAEFSTMAEQRSRHGTAAHSAPTGSASGCGRWAGRPATPSATPPARRSTRSSPCTASPSWAPTASPSTTTT